MSIEEKFNNWLRDQFFRKKLNTPFGYLFIILISIALSILIAKGGSSKIGVLLLLGIIGGPMFIAGVFSHKIGTVLALDLLM